MNFSRVRLTPYFTSLAEDCCLKSFHRKGALAKFIGQHSPDKFRIPLYTGVTTKREYLNSLFLQLSSRSDASGHAFIFEIAKSLVAMETFPDLTGWEDSREKIEAAVRARDLLKCEFKKLSQVDKDEQKIALRRESAKKNKAAVKQRTNAFDELATRLTNLTQELGSQSAGYSFEDWFYDLAVFYEIDCRKPYKDADGRQIDGSVTIDGITYLIETKFTSAAVGSQDVDIFFNKIKSKADNTMGIMVSISGYNPNAIKTASCDRTTTLLLDHTHIFSLIIPKVMSLQDVIRRVARNASQTGTSYLAAQDF